MTKQLSARAGIQVNKPVADVFEAVVNPQIMSNYFISEGSARLEADTEVQWSFPEFEGSFPVRVGEVIPGEKIVLYWEALGKEQEVTITFTPYGSATIVNVTEGNEPVTDEALDWAIGNTEGWAGFLLCMKAWLEYGIHLRKGAYDYRFDENFGK